MEINKIDDKIKLLQNTLAEVKRLQGDFKQWWYIQRMFDKDMSKDELTAKVVVLSNTTFICSEMFTRVVITPDLEECLEEFEATKQQIAEGHTFYYKTYMEHAKFKERQTRLYPKVGRFYYPKSSDEISSYVKAFKDVDGVLYFIVDGYLCKAKSLLKLENKLGRKLRGFPQGVLAACISAKGMTASTRSLSEYEKISASKLNKYMWYIFGQKSDKAIHYLIRDNIYLLKYTDVDFPYRNAYIETKGFTISEEEWQFVRILKGALRGLIGYDICGLKNTSITVEEVIERYLDRLMDCNSLESCRFKAKVIILSKSKIIVKDGRVINVKRPAIEDCKYTDNKSFSVCVQDSDTGSERMIPFYPELVM